MLAELLLTCLLQEKVGLTDVGPLVVAVEVDETLRSQLVE